MRIIIFITILLVIGYTNTQAQTKDLSSKQTKTIEINNENGELYISFENNVITKFTVNDIPVELDRYDDFQNIIDEFSVEEVEVATPAIPEPPSTDEDKPNELFTEIIDYLSDNSHINPGKKFKIQLKREYLKVNGKKLSSENHKACLDLFAQVYGHPLNERSEVEFKKSRKNYSSTISIKK